MEPRTLTRLRAGTPLRLRDVVLVPLEHTRVTVRSDGSRVLGSAAKRAAGVVILDGRDPRALDTEGRPLEIADLLVSAGGLREML